MQADLFSESDTTPAKPNWQNLAGRQVGVDEVGRGPLIGDVVAAAVILPADCQLKLKDSKKLTHQQRVELAEQIKDQALDYAISAITAAEIDQMNILQATLLAMKKAVAQLKVDFDQVLVDGNRCPKIQSACYAVIKGDAKVAEISAASILAKVYRDEQMMQLHQRYPEYGFDQHKGYPTASHLAAIQRLGLIEGYRLSFNPIKRWLIEQCIKS
jgi:ribonuclease HII